MSGKSTGAKGQHRVFRTKKNANQDVAADLPYGGDQFDNTDFRSSVNALFNAEAVRP